ncbi:MAG: prepilin-type N-terminal cleavage/methylation domain-containing protein, partial [Candidatus Gracilibacteria bacterium]|nr:prepilin-type N-terminal cleavage/methylation domain-containing protein [Candidatus Gracilibacteria bacterium]
MNLHKTKAFTLVELIIVITILAILATIGFMSYQLYTADARDGKRVADLGQMKNGLEIYQAKNSVLPVPDAQIVNIG